MTLPTAIFCVEYLGAPKLKDERIGPVTIGLFVLDVIVALGTLIVGVLGLTGVINTPIAMSYAFVGIGSVIPAMYITGIIIACANKPPPAEIDPWDF